MKDPLVQFNRHYLVRYYEDSPFLALYNEGMIRANSQQRDSFEKQCRYYGMFQMASRVLCKQVPGDFVECGCWRGHSSYMISRMIADSQQARVFHIFDSFEGGLSDRTPEDAGLRAPVDPQAIQRQKQAFYSTQEEVRRVLAPFPFVTLHPGWIPDRFKELDGRSIAFVNIDVDLYQPIRDSLNFLYPLLSAGGVIVVDDYGTTDWPGATKAVDEFLRNHEVTFSIETLGSMVMVK